MFQKYRSKYTFRSLFPLFSTNINGKADLKLRTIERINKRKILCYVFQYVHFIIDALFMEKNLKNTSKIKKIIGKDKNYLLEE